jgi:hypothetical protein
VLCIRYATRKAEFSRPKYSKVPAQAGYSAPIGLTTSQRIQIRMGLAKTTRGDVLPAFALVSLGVEPPAGIEPATPSLPWIGRHTAVLSHVFAVRATPCVP